MPDLTTAQRLAAYRDELLAKGFNAREAWEIVEAATPLFDDVTVQHDIDNTTPVATVLVNMAASVDMDSLEQAANKVERFVQSASREGGSDA
ncbi:hypothetical protein [Streptomyces sp.]|uniref:hypothetical protein n=1 Tax=Streptomyces sp. TaxID=1931 RepID=UPI002F95E91E